MAMSAYRNYSKNTSALSKNLEKLSSGYKINRAGDDAAGQAISEKILAQITGQQPTNKNLKTSITINPTTKTNLIRRSMRSVYFRTFPTHTSVFRRFTCSG